MSGNEPIPTFGRYLRLWWKSAFAPAADAFGWFGVVVGLILWAWEKYFPENFAWSAGRIGLTKEAAMSDLVWQVPLALGALVLLYRILRAPFEMQAARDKESAAVVAEQDVKLEVYRRSIDGLHEQIAGIKKAHADALQSLSDFNIHCEYGSRYGLARADGTSLFSLDNEPWLIFTDVCITNRGAARTPLEFWIYISTEINEHSMKVGERVGHAVIPDWVVERLKHETSGRRVLPDTLNLGPREVSPRCYCGIRLSGIAQVLEVKSMKEIVDDLPLWFRVEDKTANRNMDFPFNQAAHRALHGQ